MKPIYVVYKTDSHHSYASRDIIGVCTTVRAVMKVIRKQVRKEGERLDNDQNYNLLNIKQTQGYSGKGEFQYEEMEKNTLI